MKLNWTKLKVDPDPDKGKVLCGSNETTITEHLWECRLDENLEPEQAVSEIKALANINTY